MPQVRRGEESRQGNKMRREETRWERQGNEREKEKKKRDKLF